MKKKITNADLAEAIARIDVSNTDLAKAIARIDVSNVDLAEAIARIDAKIDSVATSLTESIDTLAISTGNHFMRVEQRLDTLTLESLRHGTDISEIKGRLNEMALAGA